jgi:RNA polymerase sigma-70 factor (ECF subfamily)
MTGTRDEWTVWLNQHGAALVLLARQWVPDRADAEDIVQEAFVRFWRSRHRAADPVAYLYTCVRHYALEWLRSRRRRVRREEAAARPEALDRTGLFTCPLEQAEWVQAIETALRRLPEGQREVLVLKIWGGLTFAQIAEALQIPVNTAASRYRYALARLREQLAEEPIP